MNNVPSLADFLEALPHPALIITAKYTIREANTAAQALALRVKSALPDRLRDAVDRAIADARSTHLASDEVPAALGAVQQLWVRPLQGEALLILQPINDAGSDYTVISSTMAAMLAHEIRNPLLSIKGAAQLLGSTATADDVPLAELIVSEVARIDQLMATLDPLSAAPQPSMEPLNVHELLKHAQLAVKAAVPHPVAFEAQYDPSLPEVMGQRDMLVQALVNLIRNAADATGQVAMPRITLATRYVLSDAPRNAAGVRLPIAIAIMDNGLGVPPAFVPHLFAPFATTKTSGRGLGLAIVARIAEEHGGLAMFDAPENGGARFTLYLPLGQSGATPTA